MSVRLPGYLLIALALAACTTEVRSLTHVEASLKSGPDRGPIQISYLPRELPATDEQAPAPHELEVHFNGQPLVGGGGTLQINDTAFMLDYFVPRGTATISFLRDGQTVAESDPLEFAPDRVNYLVLYGDPESPDLLVVSDPYQQRRVRLINVHERGAAVEFALADADGAPLMAASKLEYGTWWAQTVDQNAAFVQLSASGATSDEPINCDPTFRLVVHREQAGDNGSPLSVGPLLAPSRPDSPEATAATCYEPSCDCK